MEMRYKDNAVCPTCGSEFVKTRPWQVYCCAKCRNKTHTTQIKPDKEEVIRCCELCNKEFIVKKTWQKFCSNNCRIKSFHKKDKDISL